ncbi:MAG: diguanylate cyclase [Rhodospirillaceae bacterium]
MAGMDNATRKNRNGRLICLIDPFGAPDAALAEQLDHFGYTVRSLGTLAEAQVWLEEHPATAVLMNIGLLNTEQSPGVGLSRTLSCPVVFLSDTDNLAARLKAVRAGGIGFFVEPVDVAGIIDLFDHLTTEQTRVPERILVVDDDRLQGALNALVMRRAGMEVKHITNPLQTIEVLQEFEPELVLLDMYMPNCTGMELAAVIRQMEAFVGLPIVFLSAETDRDKQLEAVGLGGDDFLEKPIRPEHLISAVISRTERYRKLRSVMMRDSLTGLFNHSSITDRLMHEITRARRQDSTLSAVMLDIDHFKRVNDTHGHPVGDRVIKSLARLLTRRLRTTDIIGRYGGEEFLLILPDTSTENAATLVEQLRRAFSKLVQRAGSQEFSCTFSAGIAAFPDYDDGSTLNEAADEALYHAKKMGRNRVMVAPSPLIADINR